uniref:ATP synthase F0 subunit 8 n=1 Tax=Typhlias pearsei TaxID=1843780 RepID=UPI001F138BD9|nr:ATP synthase F0 subunit 8 [Typhlias pearsei]UMY72900.1 ATP synthase F0 subunit 8 [Typhlias pearsei]
MPQLIPTPWFTVLIFSWFILLTLIPPKVLTHTFTNMPTPQNKKEQETKPWDWPWY